MLTKLWAITCCRENKKLELIHQDNKDLRGHDFRKQGDAEIQQTFSACCPLETSPTFIYIVNSMRVIYTMQETKKQSINKNKTKQKPKTLQSKMKLLGVRTDYRAQKEGRL